MIVSTQNDLSNYLIDSITSGMLTQGEKLVLLSIARHTNRNEGWWAWPSTARLESLCCMSRKSVFNHLSSLKGLGILMTDGGQTGRSNRYRIDLGVVSRITGVEAKYAGESRDETVF